MSSTHRVAWHGAVPRARLSPSRSRALSLLAPPYRGFLDLGSGLAVGISGLAAGYAIGIVGDSGVRGTGQQPKLFVGMILILIFAEVLGLYGLIVALILSTKGSDMACHAKPSNPCCGDGYAKMSTAGVTACVA